MDRDCGQSCVKKVSKSPHGLSRRKCYDLLTVLLWRRKEEFWHLIVSIWIIKLAPARISNIALPLPHLKFVTQGPKSFQSAVMWKEMHQSVSASLLLFLWHLLITAGIDWIRPWPNKSKTLVVENSEGNFLLVPYTWYFLWKELWTATSQLVSRCPTISSEKRQGCQWGVCLQPRSHLASVKLIHSVELQQKSLNKDQCPGEKPEELESGAIYHCHSNSKATENRAKEQVYAKWKLCAASGICFVFMIAEIVGEYYLKRLLWFNKQTHKTLHHCGQLCKFSFERKISYFL